MLQGTPDYFMPAEAYWGKSPGAYEKALKAQASQTAQYQAMMDQYYAGIESQEKMFREQLDQQESQFARSLGWDKEKFGEELEWQKELGRAQLSLREYEVRTQAGIARSQMRLASQTANQQFALGLGQLNLAQQTQDWKEGFMGDQMDFFKMKWEADQQKTGVQSSIPEIKMDQGLNPYGGEVQLSDSNKSPYLIQG